MRKPFFLLPLLFGILFLAACQSKSTKTDADEYVQTDSVTFAKGFKITRFDNYRCVTVVDHWSGSKQEIRYYLVASDTVTTPTDGYKIKTPLQSLGITSCTHVEFLALIDRLSVVTGVCLPQLIYNDSLQAMIRGGQVADFGDPYNLKIEQIMSTRPEAVMLARDAQTNEQDRRLMQAGINIIYNNEWREPTVLGRAEWIKFIAAFFDCDALADSLFDATVARYREAQALTDTCRFRPTVMAGSNFKGTWYMPPGNGYMGEFFKDAGCNYLYADKQSDGSLPLSFETVLHQFNNADIWLNAPVATLRELETMDKRHTLFKSFRNHNVFAFLAREKEGGANDFWEGAVAHPDDVLKDFIWAVHPEVLPQTYKPIYILKLR